MTTKNDLIKQFKDENPTLVSIINGEEITLSSTEYDQACINWVNMRLEQLKLENAESEKTAARQAIAERLGLTVDELQVLLG